MHKDLHDMDSKNKFERPLGNVTAVANPAIYKYAGVLAAEGQGEHSEKKVEIFLRELQGVGVDEHRIATIAAIARIDFNNGMQQVRDGARRGSDA